MTHNSQCPICLDDFSAIRRKTIVLECGHKFCKKCITEHYKHISVDINGEYRCPNMDCKLYINPTTVLGKTWINRKRKIIQNNVVFPNGIFCPKANCKGFINDKTLTCLTCLSSICDKCKELSHDGDCKTETVKSVKTKESITKPCPTCFSPIEKNGGCDHMHCTKCGTSFSWDKGTVSDKSRHRIHYDRDVYNTYNPQIAQQDRPTLYLSSNPEEAKVKTPYPRISETSAKLNEHSNTNTNTNTVPNSYTVSDTIPIPNTIRTIINNTIDRNVNNQTIPTITDDNIEATEDLIMQMLLEMSLTDY